MKKCKIEELLESIEKLKDSEIKNLVEVRIKEFKENGEKTSSELFKELCFCILTANFNAEKSIKIQEKIGDGFLTLPEFKLAEELKKLGHRYPGVRAKYIVEARRYKDSLREIINSIGEGAKIREWLAKNIRGIGYKEASHFLRNIGYTDLAILDFHILNILAKHGIIEKPKALTRKKYLQIENILKKIAENLKLNLAELDLYLWYLETGKILK